MTELSPQKLAMAELSVMIDREGGLQALVFDVALSPSLLPENTPADIVSAWVRLQQAAKDLDLIMRRVNEQWTEIPSD